MAEMSTKTQPKVDNLERKSAIRILIFIYSKSAKEDAVHLSNIIRGVEASSDTIQKTVDELVDCGFLTDEYTQTHPQRRIFRLTKLGFEVARSLADIEDAMRSPPT